MSTPREQYEQVEQQMIIHQLKGEFDAAAALNTRLLELFNQLADEEQKILRNRPREDIVVAALRVVAPNAEIQVAKLTAEDRRQIELMNMETEMRQLTKAVLVGDPNSEEHKKNAERLEQLYNATANIREQWNDSLPPHKYALVQVLMFLVWLLGPVYRFTKRMLYWFVA